MEREKKKYDYNKDGLRTALLKVGLKKGDVIFSHIGMGFLGYPEEGSNLESIFQVIYDAFSEVLGPEGTWLVPTYSYSFCHGETFDINNTPSVIGYFTERFRTLPAATRSKEPIFSVSGIGPATAKLFKDLPMNCFGHDCIYDRLLKANAFICNLGVGFRYATFVHYVERIKRVPYRFEKIFKGNIIDEGKQEYAKIVYFVRKGLDDKSTFPDLSRLEIDAVKSGYLKSQPIGKSRVTNISCQHLFKLCSRGINKDPWYLAKGG